MHVFWLGAFLVVVVVLRGCFDGCKNKELKNKEALFEGQKEEKFKKVVKKISDVWCS
jgi:hypothetical protein